MIEKPPATRDVPVETLFLRNNGLSRRLEQTHHAALSFVFRVIGLQAFTTTSTSNLFLLVVSHALGHLLPATMELGYGETEVGPACWLLIVCGVEKASGAGQRWGHWICMEPCH